MVPRARGGGPAHVDSSVLALDVHDDEVAVSQHLGVVNVDRLAVGSAPGDDGSGMAGGHALQDGGLVQRHRAVLRRCDDAGPLWTQGPRCCRRGKTQEILRAQLELFLRCVKESEMFKETRLTACFAFTALDLLKPLNAPGVTVSVASLLRRRLAMLVAMQR